MPTGKYTSNNISSPPFLLVGGEGVNLETLNENCYFFIVDSESMSKSVYDLSETFFSSGDRWR